jgi:riboflavin biosynthesis pyrimidine reductase
MRQIYPPPAGADEPDLAELYAYPDLSGRTGKAWVRANMVTSADGAATLEGRSGGLSGPADRHVFAALRGLADVILAGAGTARAERYGPAEPGGDGWSQDGWAKLRAGRPLTTPIAVVTRRLDLDLDGPLLAAAPPDSRTIVVTTQAAPPSRRDAAADRHADVIVAGAGHVDLAAAVRALAERGYPRILCEGGPRLLAQLAGRGLLDEYCLTVSPLLAGGGAGRVMDAAGGHAVGNAGHALAGAGAPGAAADSSLGRMALCHVLEDDGFLLCRYVSVPAVTP